MSIPRSVHPEFGYMGTHPRFLPRLGAVVGFVVFGLVAGANGLKSLTWQRDESHPGRPAALSSAEAGIAATGPAARSGPAAKRNRDSEPAQVPAGSASDSASVRVDRLRPAFKERPAIAAVPIGHRQDPAVLPPEPATPAVAAQTQDPKLPLAPETAPTALPISPASAPAVIPTRAPDGGAKTPPAATRSRDGAKVVVKRAELEDKQRSGSHSGQRQRSARMRASPVDNDVISSWEKQLAAHARALGIHVPPALLDLAREMID
jgi:hypothetical protein